MPDLTVIDGGGGERKFHKSPYADALYKAIYPIAANSYAEIAKRMGVSIDIVNNTIHHVRVWAEYYGWTIPHVQKGRSGEQRLYFPVMLEGNSPALRSMHAKECLQEGSASSCLTIATMAEHEAVAMDAAADAAGVDAKKRREYRAVAAIFTAASKMAREVLGHLR